MDWRQLCEQLRAVLCRPDALGQSYALIDLANLAGNRAAALRWLKSNGAVNVLFDDRPEAELACPWLLPLVFDAKKAQGTDIVERSVRWATQSACVIWLGSQLPLPLLARALYQRTQAELPDQMAIMLRMYDPRVLPELARVLEGDPQARGYWAIAGTWLFLDRQQQLQTMAVQAICEPDVFDAPLMLDQTQADALLAAAEVDRVMPELVRESPEAFLALSTDERLKLTRQALAMADDLALVTHADRVSMGVLCLELGVGFTQQAPWREALAQLKSGRLKFTEAVQQALTS